MKNAIKIILKYLKYYFWLSPFQKALLASKNNKVGKILLFNKEFHYHFGLAFYDTFNEIFINNIYEFKSTSIRPVIVDCGANMGLSILFFSKQFPNAEIIAFEPDEVVLPFLEKNMICQNIKNVVIHKKAVWNEETELTFYTDSGLGGRVGIQYVEQTPKTVKTARLQEFLKRPIDMLKMDIEGAEYIVLKDCEDFLINVKHIFIEYHSFYDEEQHLDDVLNILKRQGFRYHLRQSFSRNNPFVNTNLVCEKFDMAINVFAYKN